MESPPARVVWIEIPALRQESFLARKSPPARVVWIEIIMVGPLIQEERSPPARVVWIEMFYTNSVSEFLLVATREGGVD